jgi:hypothetical protein
VVAAYGWLEWGFIVLVGTMTLLAGIFAIYVVVQTFRNPRRR